jgi:hypothetical protein
VTRLTEEVIAAIRKDPTRLTKVEVPWETFRELFHMVAEHHPERFPLTTEVDNRQGLLLFGVPVVAHNEEGWFALFGEEEE